MRDWEFTFCVKILKTRNILVTHIMWEFGRNLKGFESRERLGSLRKFGVFEYAERIGKRKKLQLVEN